MNGSGPGLHTKSFFFQSAIVIANSAFPPGGPPSGQFRCNRARIFGVRGTVPLGVGLPGAWTLSRYRPHTGIRYPRLNYWGLQAGQILTGHAGRVVRHGKREDPGQSGRNEIERHVSQTDRHQRM